MPPATTLGPLRVEALALLVGFDGLLIFIFNFLIHIIGGETGTETGNWWEGERLLHRFTLPLPTVVSAQGPDFLSGSHAGARFL
jgi:hypothetical protein